MVFPAARVWVHREAAAADIPAGMAADPDPVWVDQGPAWAAMGAVQDPVWAARVAVRGPVWVDQAWADPVWAEDPRADAAEWEWGVSAPLCSRS